MRPLPVCRWSVAKWSVPLKDDSHYQFPFCNNFILFSWNIDISRYHKGFVATISFLFGQPNSIATFLLLFFFSNGDSSKTISIELKWHRINYYQKRKTKINIKCKGTNGEHKVAEESWKCKKMHRVGEIENCLRKRSRKSTMKISVMLRTHSFRRNKHRRQKRKYIRKH